MAEPRVRRLELPFFAADLGAPLRLLVPVKLGLKNIKAITADYLR
jgi:DMSO/TMAO reductase YedYZ molybdopterin-dependent catalytic subunit